MSKKTTVIFNPNGIIKDIALGVGILESLQDLLLYYLTNLEDENEIKEVYKKINLAASGEKVNFIGSESHIYVLVALVQNLRSLAIEQGVAKEVDIDDAVHLKAKEIANLFIKRDPNDDELLKNKLDQLLELTKDLTVD